MWPQSQQLMWQQWTAMQQQQQQQVVSQSTSRTSEQNDPDEWAIKAAHWAQQQQEQHHQQQMWQEQLYQQQQQAYLQQQAYPQQQQPQPGYYSNSTSAAAPGQPGYHQQPVPQPQQGYARPYSQVFLPEQPPFTQPGQAYPPPVPPTQAPPTLPPAQPAHAAMAPPPQLAASAPMLPQPVHPPLPLAQAVHPTSQVVPPSHTGPYSQPGPPSQTVPQPQVVPHSHAVPHAHTVPQYQPVPPSQTAPHSQAMPLSQAVPHSQAASHSQIVPHSQTTLHSQTTSYSQSLPHSQAGPLSQGVPHFQTGPPSRPGPQPHSVPEPQPVPQPHSTPQTSTFQQVSSSSGVQSDQKTTFPETNSSPARSQKQSLLGVPSSSLLPSQQEQQQQQPPTGVPTPAQGAEPPPGLSMPTMARDITQPSPGQTNSTFVPPHLKQPRGPPASPQLAKETAVNEPCRQATHSPQPPLSQQPKKAEQHPFLDNGSPGGDFHRPPTAVPSPGPRFHRPPPDPGNSYRPRPDPGRAFRQPRPSFPGGPRLRPGYFTGPVDDPPWTGPNVDPAQQSHPRPFLPQLRGTAMQRSVQVPPQWRPIGLPHSAPSYERVVSDRPPTETLFREEGAPPSIRNMPPSSVVGQSRDEIADSGDVGGEGPPGGGRFPLPERGPPGDRIPQPGTTRQLFAREHAPEQGYPRQPPFPGVVGTSASGAGNRQGDTVASLAMSPNGEACPVDDSGALVDLGRVTNDVKEEVSIPAPSPLSSVAATPGSIPGLDLLTKAELVDDGKGDGSAKASDAPDGGSEERPARSNQVMESLGKIVNQLQTLQGLSSSLRLLEAIPNYQAKRKEEQREAETKKTVEAFLENESDSDDDSGGGKTTQGRPGHRPYDKEGGNAEPEADEPPARDFDGYAVKPHVFGTYKPDSYDCPPAEFDHPPAGFDHPPAGFDHPPAGFDHPPVGFDHPPPLMDRRDQGPGPAFGDPALRPGPGNSYRGRPPLEPSSANDSWEGDEGGRWGEEDSGRWQEGPPPPHDRFPPAHHHVRGQEFNPASRMVLDDKEEDDGERFCEQEGFPNDEVPFEGRERDFPPRDGHFHAREGPYPPREVRFPPRGEPFPPQDRHFADRKGPLPPRRGPFPSPRGPFPPPEDPFPPPRGPFPPPEDPFPPYEGTYPPPHEDPFPSHKGSFPPREHPFPPHKGPRLIREDPFVHGDSSKETFSHSDSHYGEEEPFPGRYVRREALLVGMVEDRHMFPDRQDLFPDRGGLPFLPPEDAFPLADRSRPPPRQDPGYLPPPHAHQPLGLGDRVMETIDYSHGGGGSSSSVLANMQSVDYGHGQRLHDSETDLPPAYGQPDYGFPPQGFDNFPPPSGFAGGGYGQFAGMPTTSDQAATAAFFAAYAAGATPDLKRKVLPQWLREGLEKLEREKMKKMEREAREAAASDHPGRPSWREELDDDDEGGGRDGAERSPVAPAGSRSYRHRRRAHSPSPGSGREVRSPSPRQQMNSDDEEDKHVIMINKVRRMLTEVLLDVTTYEIREIARGAIENYQRGGAKAIAAVRTRQPLELAGAANPLGLGVYGSDSESERSPTPGSRLLLSAAAADIQGRTIAVIERAGYQDGGGGSHRASRWDAKMRDREEAPPAGSRPGMAVSSSSSSARDELIRSSASSSDRKRKHRSRSPRDKNKDHSSSKSKSDKGRHHSGGRHGSSSKERKSASSKSKSSSSSSGGSKRRSRSRSPRAKSRRRSRSPGNHQHRKGQSHSPGRRQK